jgi:hypothetical protein
MPSHKRGGSYSLKIMTDITNWGGTKLNREILNYLQEEDTVRVIFEPYDAPRYITITNVLKNGYFKGVVDDCYNQRYCDICESDRNIKKGKDMHYCENDLCEFDCHLECIKKYPEKICKCDKNIYKIVKWKPYLLNGSKIIFKKNNICEIPNWSKNTEKLIELYELNKRYLITGVR